MTPHLLNYAVTTIFAREFMEGAIVIGEFRTIIMLGGDDALAPGVTKTKALAEVTRAAIGAALLAFFGMACVAISLVFLALTMDGSSARIVKGISGIIAGISLQLLALKLPRMLGIYDNRKKVNLDDSELDVSDGMTLPSIRFIVAWNIWREISECGIFLLPFFLNGNDSKQIPLSAIMGAVIGLLLGFGIFVANKRLSNRLHLCIFATLLLVLLSAGLFTGGCHVFEETTRKTQVVWTITGDFWGVNHFPMAILEPFGYSDSRTVLQICSYWSWLVLNALLHYRVYRISPKISESSGTELGEEDSLSFCSVETGDGLGMEELTLPSNENDRRADGLFTQKSQIPSEKGLDSTH